MSSPKITRIFGFCCAVAGALALQLVKQFRIPDIFEFRLRIVTAYGIGTVAAFLFIERFAGIWV